MKKATNKPCKPQNTSSFPIAGIRKKRNQTFDFVHVSFYSSAVANPTNDRVYKMEYRQPALSINSSNGSSNGSSNSSKSSESKTTYCNEKNVPIFHWNIGKDTQQPLIPLIPNATSSPNSSSSFSSLKSSNTLLKGNNLSPLLSNKLSNRGKSVILTDQDNHHKLTSCNDAFSVVMKEVSNHKSNRIQRTRVFTINELLEQSHDEN